MARLSKWASIEPREILWTTFCSLLFPSPGASGRFPWSPINPQNEGSPPVLKTEGVESRVQSASAYAWITTEPPITTTSAPRGSHQSPRLGLLIRSLPIRPSANTALPILVSVSVKVALGPRPQAAKLIAADDTNEFGLSGPSTQLLTSEWQEMGDWGPASECGVTTCLLGLKSTRSRRVRTEMIGDNGQVMTNNAVIMRFLRAADVAKINRCFDGGIAKAESFPTDSPVAGVERKQERAGTLSITSLHHGRLPSGRYPWGLYWS